MTPARRHDLLMALTAAVLVVIDQLTKLWIVSYFARHPSPIPVLGNVLDIEYVQNNGVAFSLLAGQTVLFVFIAIAIVVIGTLYWRTRDSASLPLKLTFGLILGGAVGNLLDRFTRGYVVDFIHFHLDAIGFNFAVFNVADSGITVGVILLAVLLWFGGAQTKPQPAANDAKASMPPPPAQTRERDAESTPRVRNRAVGGR
ncbi:MAG TPA: signal peptidase II [Ktedonobacterales bacterium]